MNDVLIPSLAMASITAFSFMESKPFLSQRKLMPWVFHICHTECLIVLKLLLKSSCSSWSRCFCRLLWMIFVYISLLFLSISMIVMVFPSSGIRLCLRHFCLFCQRFFCMHISAVPLLFHPSPLLSHFSCLWELLPLPLLEILVNLPSCRMSLF